MKLEMGCLCPPEQLDISIQQLLGYFYDALTLTSSFNSQTSFLITFVKDTGLN